MGRRTRGVWSDITSKTGITRITISLDISEARDLISQIVEDLIELGRRIQRISGSGGGSVWGWSRSVRGMRGNKAGGASWGRGGWGAWFVGYRGWGRCRGSIIRIIG
jgi:hypothetical protein